MSTVRDERAWGTVDWLLVSSTTISAGIIRFGVDLHGLNPSGGCR